MVGCPLLSRASYSVGPEKVFLRMGAARCPGLHPGEVTAGAKVLGCRGLATKTRLEDGEGAQSEVVR